MAPRDFNQDGAAGAYGGNGGAPNSGAIPETNPIPSSAAGAPSNALANFSVGGGFDMNPGDAGAYAQALSGKKSPNQIMAGGFLTPGGWRANGMEGAYTTFADGGEVPDDSGGDNANLVSLALASVDSALNYGRQKYGLTDGDQQVAGAIPDVPGGQSESGAPRPLPMPGPLPPTANPFGRRQGQPFGRVADNMPSSPGTQSESGRVGIPAPGPLVPLSNPFGKRQGQPFGRTADASGSEGDDSQGAIPDDESEEAA